MCSLHLRRLWDVRSGTRPYLPLLIVRSSALSSFLTFSIARIGSGMPGRVRAGGGGTLSVEEEKRLCVSSSESFQEDRDETK